MASHKCIRVKGHKEAGNERKSDKTGKRIWDAVVYFGPCQNTGEFSDV